MVSNTFTLTTLQEGEKAKVHTLLSTGSIRRRLQDLGLITGTTIECLQKSPYGDPVAYKIRGAVIALRSEDANTIIIERYNKK